MKRSDILVGIIIAAAGWAALLFVSRALHQSFPFRRSSPRVIGPLQRGSLRKIDQNGDIWVFDMASGPRIASTDPNGPKVGLPIVVKTDVRRIGDQVLVALVLEGQAGERYRPIRKNGRLLGAPKLRIVNEAGQEVVNDRFAYG